VNSNTNTNAGQEEPDAFLWPDQKSPTTEPIRIPETATGKPKATKTRRVAASPRRRMATPVSASSSVVLRDGISGITYTERRRIKRIRYSRVLEAVTLIMVAIVSGVAVWALLTLAGAS
jgi:hypothetical protein